MMRREYAMFLEDMEIESALSAGSAAFNLDDLADVGTHQSNTSNFDDLLGVDLDPIAGREKLGQSLAAFSVSDLDWVLAELAKSSVSKAAALAQVDVALDDGALDLPLAD